MNIIIAGSRDFNHYEFLKEKCDEIIKNLNTTEPITIISGGAEGADRLGERYAKEKGYFIIGFYPDWTTNGKSAGPIRNFKMSLIGNVLIAFWDGKSKGTRDMIKKATDRGLLVNIIIR